MKITPENYEVLRTSIAAIFTKEKHEAHRQFIIHEGKACDVDRRLRWDWLWYATLPASFVVDQLYGANDLNDDHIDTALRAIINELGEAI